METTYAEYANRVNQLLQAIVDGDRAFFEKNGPEMAAAAERAARAEAAEGEAKVARVNRWLEQNASHGARAMVDKFKLAYSFEGDCGNGIAKVGFYTDDSLNHKVCQLHLVSAEWFRA